MHPDGVWLISTLDRDRFAFLKCRGSNICTISMRNHLTQFDLSSDGYFERELLTALAQGFAMSALGHQQHNVNARQKAIFNESTSVLYN